MTAASVPIGVNQNDEGDILFLSQMKDRLSFGFRRPGEYIQIEPEEIQRVCGIAGPIIRSEPNQSVGN